MEILVRLGVIHESLPIATLCSPLLHGDFSQGVIFEKSSDFSPLQLSLRWHFQSGCNSWKVLPLQSIAAHSYMTISVTLVVIPESPPIAALCSPFLHGNISQGVIIKIPPIAAHCSPLLLGIFNKRIILEKSSQCSPLQPTPTWQFLVRGLFLKSPPIAAHCSLLLHMVISVRLSVIHESPPIAALCSSHLHGNFIQGVNFEKSSDCSPLQLTLRWHFQSGCNSWKVLTLQPIATHSYMAISVMLGVVPESPPIAALCSPLLHGNFSQGVIFQNSSDCSPLQPTLTWHF